MMTDIVERLRTKHIFGALEIGQQREEAADEIEQLRNDARAASELLSEATRRAVSAVSKVVSGRDDLGNVHFVELSDAIITALSSLSSAQCGDAQS